jgi:hypothetical protein
MRRSRLGGPHDHVFKLVEPFCAGHWHVACSFLCCLHAYVACMA